MNYGEECTFEFYFIASRYQSHRMHKKYFVKFLKEVIRHSHFFSYTIFNYMFKRIHF